MIDQKSMQQHPDSPENQTPSKIWSESDVTGQEGLQNNDFLTIISIQMADFLKIIPALTGGGQEHAAYSKRFYEYINSQAKLAEALLDSCGAKENRAWFLLRELIATIRCLSIVAYELRYLEIRIASFESLEIDALDFHEITADVRKIFDRLLRNTFKACEREALNLGITVPENGITLEDFPLFQSPGKLQADMRDEQLRKEDEAIIKIATSFLEIAEGYTALGFGHLFTAQQLAEMVPDHLNEERLRAFEAGVQNLQTIYDTHIQYTDMEAQDSRLPKLRGCISIALHLLEIATELMHFHERHERNARQAAIYKNLQKIIGLYQTLDLMGNYALFYCTQFLQEGKRLSEEAVMDYAQVISKRISIPIYRGFHVRPSTYVAKIIHHYGADVQMYLGDEGYDASCVFDLFRVNEEINMEKRRVIAKKLLSSQNITAVTGNLLPHIFKRVLNELIDEQLVVQHQEILPGDLDIRGLEESDLTTEEVRGAMNQMIARALAIGKIDILMPLSVTFIGDRRPLEDIKILAENGYGEDAQGNNVPLPQKLSYLYK
ncbi:hypothetical protein CSA56_16345 [candidate division KSB3 bacterium]|uniref:HPr domain-containing protein n=1 Tax=candidate division KSB3 bacterium TaxID=2044937 RepID=A0A2G6K926_9BACT|nr:MAG: hypothetical protein CSA56_16345 [candidate division KSB3 bacterium]